MKIYKFTEGGVITEWTALPDPFKNTTPMTDELFVQLGGIIEENSRYDEEFEEACVMFRALCAQIGQFIGNPDFHGGFGEMASFAQSEAYQQNPVMGNTLAIQWAALNEECKYFGSRIGLGQPQWYYRCWELVGLDLPDPPTDENEFEDENQEDNIIDEDNSEENNDDETSGDINEENSEEGTEG